MGSRFLHHIGRQLCPQQNGIFQIDIDGTDWTVISDPEFNKQVLTAHQFISPFDLFFAHEEEYSSFPGRQDLRSEPGTRILRSRYFEVIGRELNRENLHAKHIPTAWKIFRSDLQVMRAQLMNQNTSMNMVEFYRRTTMRICSIILLGTDLTENSRWDKVGRALSLSGGRPNSSRRKFKPFTHSRNRKTMKSLMRSIDELIETRRSKRACDPLGEEPQDFLDALLGVSTVSESGATLCSTPREVLRDALLAALSHSYNSTASMLSWATYFLFDPALGFQELRHCVQQEVDHRERKHPLSSLQYLSSTPVASDQSLLVATLQETLRLHSPVPGLIRKCTTSVMMGDYFIPEGSLVILSIQGTHLNDQCWEDPLRFDPYRFVTSPLLPFSYLPWSMGDHTCASGMDFTLPLARMILKSLLSDFHVRLESNKTGSGQASSFLYPESLMGTLSVRENHPPVLRREHERTSLQVSSLALRSHTKRYSLSSSFEAVGRSPGLVTTIFNGENSPTRAWASILSTIQRKEYPFYIAAGTNNTNGQVMNAAYWFCEKFSALSFNMGSSPFCLNDLLSALHGLDSPEFLVIGICVATYQGKPSKNAEAFVTWLNRCLKELQRGNLTLRTSLRHVHYFVFSVGESEWKEDFQRVGNLIDDTLFLLGATRLCDIKSHDVGQDDLAESCSETFVTAVPPLLSYLPEIGNKKLRNLDTSFLTETARLKPTSPESSLRMEVVEGEGKSFFSLVESPCPIHLVSIQSMTLHKASSPSRSENSPGATKSSSISIDLVVDRVSDMVYVPGDSILIYPVIPPEIVQEVITFFPQYTVDTVVKWSSPAGSPPPPYAKSIPLGVLMRLDSILSYLVNVLAIPSRQFLMNLSTLVKNSAHMTTLEQHSQNAETYAYWVSVNPGVRILDLLNMYHVREDALEQLLQSLPALRPQSYPIYTSYKYHQDSMGIFVVDSPSNNSTIQHLLHLHQSKPAGESESRSKSLYISLQPGQMLSLTTMPSEPTPCLIISKGRSVAPFISLLYDAAYLSTTLRCYFFHCVGDEEGKRGFVLRKALRKLKRLNMIEMLAVTHSADLIQQLQSNQDNIWTFINQLKSPVFLGGCHSTFRAKVLEEFSQTIQNHCVPLVFRKHPQYADAFIQLLREKMLFREVWY